MDLPLLQKITTYLRHGISLNLKTFIHDEQTMEADCKKLAKRYEHANNHIIKTFRGRQTLLGKKF